MNQPDTNPDAVKLLSDDALREVETRTSERERNRVFVSLLPSERDSLCATVRALRDENSTLKKHWADTSEDLASAWLKNGELMDQLAQVTQERDELRKCDACERKAIERACRSHGGRP